MTCRSKVIKMTLRVFYKLTIFYDLNVIVGHELDRGQKRTGTTSCSVLTRWQPTKSPKSFFHVHDNLKALYIYIYIKDHIVQGVNPQMFYRSHEVFLVFVSWNHTSRASLRRDAMSVIFYVGVA